MEVNQDLIILEAEVVLADMEDLAVADTVGIQETIEAEEKEVTIRTTETATVDVVDGNTVKLKDLNLVNYSKVK